MPIRQRLRFTGVLLVVVGLATPSAWAQFSSTLEGTVSDQSGAVVPGATVTTSNEATGVTQNVSTTSAGYYRFPALPGGVYTVKVSSGSWSDSQASRAGHANTSGSNRPRRAR